MKYEDSPSSLIDAASIANKKFKYVQIHYKTNKKLLEERKKEHVYGYFGQEGYDKIVIEPTHGLNWDYWRTKGPNFKWDTTRIENKDGKNSTVRITDKDIRMFDNLLGVTEKFGVKDFSYGMQTFLSYDLASGFFDNITTKREYRLLSKFLDYIKFENITDDYYGK